jgi:beta-fructofuranosidase
MLITATDRYGHGCVGHATSDDLTTWTVEEPLAIKTGFLQLEVLQIVDFGGTPVLFFSCLDTDISLDTVERRTGFYSAPAESALGPFALDRSEPVGPEGLYAGRVVETADGPVMLGFRNVTASRPFEGVIGEPIRLTLTSRGTAAATER